jgi:hypothetical protein
MLQVKNIRKVLKKDFSPSQTGKKLWHFSKNKIFFEKIIKKDINR